MDILSFICLIFAIFFIMFTGLFFEKYYKYYLCLFEDNTFCKFSGIFFNLSIEKLEKKYKKNVRFCKVYKDTYSLTSALLYYNKLYKDIDTEVLHKDYLKKVG